MDELHHVWWGRLFDKSLGGGQRVLRMAGEQRIRLVVFRDIQRQLSALITDPIWDEMMTQNDAGGSIGLGVVVATAEDGTFVAADAWDFIARRRCAKSDNGYPIT